jgi:pentapeptide repeat protein
MANAEQLALLKAGVEGWNKWRKEEPDEKIDLRKADLAGADLSGSNLHQADLSDADLREANLSKANLRGAELRQANLREADLREANLIAANLIAANLSGANLRDADLSSANLGAANLRDADLLGTYLMYSNLVQANISNAKISQCNVYGVNIWDLVGEFKEQKDLVITPPRQPSITVDNIKVAQFVYLILNNKEIRDVINTLTSKTVLILGRFAIPERKAILDALRDKLREYDLLPIVFDFDRPSDKDFTETIKTLAGLCYFVIADVTNPKSSPLELQATVPDYQIPFVPIIQAGERPFAMMFDLQKKYDWVLDTLSYSSADELIKALKPAIIDPAIQKHNELRLIKAREPRILSASDFIEDKGLDNPTQ